MSESPLAKVVYTDPSNPSEGVLQIWAHRIGSYLTAGRALFEIPISDGPEFRKAIGQFLQVKEHPVRVVLNGREWLIDSTLSGDVMGALAIMLCDVDLPPELLAQYPPDP